MKATLCPHCGGHVDRCRCAWTELREAVQAMGALVDFHNLPLAMKRPDIYQRLMNNIGRALEACEIALAHPKGDE